MYKLKKNFIRLPYYRGKPEKIIVKKSYFFNIDRHNYVKLTIIKLTIIKS